MEISLLEVLLKNISAFLQISKLEKTSSDPVQKYCLQKAEDILKLLKLILDTIVKSELASDEVLNKDFQELGQSVDELREIFENWQPLSSKVHFVSFELFL
ncbi:RING-TYPE E3 UBIQUITIN TRANSFERASE [Salix viminalis]|uniref:RING-TYPE E3 UBIQUITIN TRANSFERASE n=1 Tax=Salix viminalis TaxID=40686 RepID=A0A9Q0SEI3_SALVM|nr:RING-TYPE E3 UBIQUITIN TRANSFERASE [Salix viminalis]